MKVLMATAIVAAANIKRWRNNNYIGLLLSFRANLQKLDMKLMNQGSGYLTKHYHELITMGRTIAQWCQFLVEADILALLSTRYDFSVSYVIFFAFSLNG